MENNIYVYTLGNKIYINLTNRCSNSCDFCIRRDHKDMDGQVLWINDEPTVEDVIEQLPENLDDYDNEIVFADTASRLIISKRWTKWQATCTA